MPHMDPAIARRTLVAGLPVALISSCLAGCRSQGQSAVRESSSSSHGNLSVPAAMRLPQGWTWVEGSDIPVAKATLRLPVTTTDGTGRRVTIKNADRIIVGGEDVADILAALGWRKLIYAAPTNSVAEAPSMRPNITISARKREWRDSCRSMGPCSSATTQCGMAGCCQVP